MEAHHQLTPPTHSGLLVIGNDRYARKNYQVLDINELSMKEL